jgi:hypothetical protein
MNMQAAASIDLTVLSARLTRTLHAHAAGAEIAAARPKVFPAQSSEQAMLQPARTHA